MMDRFPVRKTATCQRCNSKSVFWCRSMRSGRYYLVDVAADGTAARNAFHACAVPRMDGTSHEEQRSIDALARQFQPATVGIMPAPEIRATVDLATKLEDASDEIHAAVEEKIAANKGTLVDSLQRMYDATPAAVQAKPQPTAQIQAQPSVKQGLYACSTASNITVTATIQPGKPVMCKHCQRVMRFVKVVS